MTELSGSDHKNAQAVDRYICMGANPQLRFSGVLVLLLLLLVKGII